MAELMEIPLELQLKEANRQIKMHLSKGRKFQQFLSSMFLRHFPAIMCDGFRALATVSPGCLVMVVKSHRT